MISLMRPASSEAVAGKNMVSHIGKIYNILSFDIANKIYQNVSGIDEVFVWMHNLIGNPVHSPNAVVVQPIWSRDNKKRKQHDGWNKEIEDIVNDSLNKIDDIYDRFIAGDIHVA